MTSLRGFLAALAQPLLDGDGGRYARDVIDIGSSHDFEELASVGGETVDITALAFRIDDIESQRRFSRPAQTGEDHEAVTRDIQADIFQIVFLRPDDRDGVYVHRSGHGMPCLYACQGGRKPRPAGFEVGP
jgi:hypothetical protein